MQKTLLTLLFTLFTIAGASAQDGSGRFNGQRDGKHAVSFSPFGFMVAYDYFNPAFGFDYEYTLSQEKGIALRLPFAMGFIGPDQSFGSSYRHQSFYFAPGVRFNAPLGRRAAFGTGPAVLLGNMHFSPDNDIVAPGVVRQPYNYALNGLIVDNSLNIYNRHFMFGIDARVGTLIEEREGSRFFMHLGMHFGGKF